MIQRIPRPLGLTIQCRGTFHNQNPSPQKTKEVQQIKHHILNQYFLNNQTINNKQLSIEQVANYLQLPTIEIIRFMYKRLGYMQGFKEGTHEDMQGLLRELLFRTILGSLHHSQQLQGQADRLLALQGDRYVPYLTAEVNNALRGTLAADANMQALIRLLQPQAPTLNLFNLTSKSTDPNAQSQEALTTTDAVALLEAKGLNNLLTDPERKAAVYLEQNLQNMPEVRAVYQQGSLKDKQYGTSTQDITAEEVGPKPKPKHAERRVEDFEDTDEM